MIPSLIIIHGGLDLLKHRKWLTGELMITDNDTLSLSHLPGKLFLRQTSRPNFSAVGKDYCAFDQYHLKVATIVITIVIFMHTCSLCKN